VSSLLIVGRGRMGRLVEALSPDYGFQVAGTVDIDNAAQDHVFFEKFLAEEGPIWIELVKGLNLEPQ